MFGRRSAAEGCVFVTDETVTVLDPDAGAAGRARQLLRGFPCSAHNALVVVEVAEVLVSELVTNALLHGRPPIVLQIRCLKQDGLWVGVSDANPLPPVIRGHDVEATHGRGMALVNMLSDDWGVQLADRGKQVWFRVRGFSGP
jgi:anti-sigma regulatory factor (Ser/Thr protein kinase)